MAETELRWTHGSGTKMRLWMDTATCKKVDVLGFQFSETPLQHDTRNSFSLSWGFGPRKR